MKKNRKSEPITQKVALKSKEPKVGFYVDWKLIAKSTACKLIELNKN